MYMNKKLYKSFKQIGKKKTFNSWKRDVIKSVKKMNNRELFDEIEHYKIELEKKTIIKPFTILEMVSGFMTPIIVCLITIMAMEILQENINIAVQHLFVKLVGEILIIIIVVIGIIVILGDFSYNHKRANKLSFYQRMITIMDAQYKKRKASRNRRNRRQ